MRGSIYTNGNFVVTGFHGTIISSPDGTNWVVRSSGVTDALRDVAHGLGAFVAVGHNGRIVRTVSLVAPTLANANFGGNTFKFSFASVNGLIYAIEYKSNLTDSGWTLLNTTNGTGGLIPINDTTATVPRRFYRVGTQ